MCVPCGLLISVPGGWETDPGALAKLRRHRFDGYGMMLDVQPAASPMRVPTAMRLARRAEDQELRIRIDRSFFTLEWLGLKDVF